MICADVVVGVEKRERLVLKGLIRKTKSKGMERQ
jgi:hypothetical protein